MNSYSMIIIRLKSRMMKLKAKGAIERETTIAAVVPVTAVAAVGAVGAVAAVAAKRAVGAVGAVAATVLEIATQLAIEQKTI